MNKEILLILCKKCRKTKPKEFVDLETEICLKCKIKPLNSSWWSITLFGLGFFGVAVIAYYYFTIFENEPDKTKVDFDNSPFIINIVKFLYELGGKKLVIFLSVFIGSIICLIGLLDLRAQLKNRERIQNLPSKSPFTFYVYSENDIQILQNSLIEIFSIDKGLKELYLLKIKYDGENYAKPLLCIKSDTRYEELMNILSEKCPILLQSIDIMFYRYLKLRDRKSLHNTCSPFFIK